MILALILMSIGLVFGYVAVRMFPYDLPVAMVGTMMFFLGVLNLIAELTGVQVIL